MASGKGPPGTAASSCSAQTFPVDRIGKESFRKSGNRIQTFYKVYWKGYSKKESTHEPLENLIDCPELVLEMEKRREAAFKRSLPSSLSVTNFTRKMKSLPVKIVSQLKKDFEYVAKGDELVKKIYSSFENGGESFLIVKFKGDMTYRKIRRCVMDYYFPTDVLLFLKKVSVADEQMLDARDE